MKKISLNEALAEITRRDNRYDEHAYLFLREALDHTIKMLAKPAEGPGRHVTGRELLDGVRDYALKEYGPLAHTVLRQWGITQCEDIGEMVFNLVDMGVLGKTDQDRKEDFRGGYDFAEAFRKPYLPAQSETTTPGDKVTSATKS